jgi:hypothetical protein
MTGGAAAAPRSGRTLRGQAAAMRRGVWVAGPAAGVAAVLGSWWVAGVSGLLSGLLGVVLGIGSALFTLWLMHRTADREPRAVMVASIGGFVQKMIILLVALWLADLLPGVHRMSLAVSLLVVLIAVAGAEGWAGYRFRSPALELERAADPSATSGSSS